MSTDLSSLDFKKKGWSKGKLVEVAAQFNIDLGEAATFHQVRAVLVAAQKNISLGEEVPAEECSTHDSPHDRVLPSPVLVRNEHAGEVMQDGHMSNERISNAMSEINNSFLPSVDLPSSPNPSALSDNNSTGEISTHFSFLPSRHSSEPDLSSTALGAESISRRSVQVKRSVYEECKAMCDNIGIPNSEMVSLNFLCERSLPPDYYDKNDDDQSKAMNAAARAMGVVSGEPYYPHDNDVINRDLKLSHSGEYIICEHEDFPENKEEINPKSMPQPECTVNHEIRVLWLKLPIFQSRYAPYRNEKIEFAVDTNNTSKMMLDVDRTIRSLICVHNTYGLAKRNDKRNAFYLLNATGDVILLNVGLLLRCPLKNGSTCANNKESKPLWTEPLYLCLYDAVPGDNPKPAIIRNREWKYVFPFPELCKCVFLLTLLLLSTKWHLNLWSNDAIGNSSVSWAWDIWNSQNEWDLISNLWYFCNNIFLNNRGINTFVQSVRVLQQFPFCVKGAVLINTLCRAFFSLVLSYFIPNYDYLPVDFTVPLFYIFVGYGMILVMRLRSKFCIFNVSWFVINRYWYLMTDFSLRKWVQDKVGRSTSKSEANQRNQVFLCTRDRQRPGVEHDDALMYVRYEEMHITRFLVYRWLPTSNFEEDYELWSSTLRAALGIVTSSQSGPDMLISDPESSGLRIALSPAFLKFEMYKNRSVFKICKPGRVSQGYENFFKTPFMLVACSCWVWMDVILPFLYYSTGDNSSQVTFPSSSFSIMSITTLLVNFLWRNTLSSLIVDLADIDPDYWPRWAGYSYSVPSILALCVGTLLW